jgi:hypothetical protein
MQDSRQNVISVHRQTALNAMNGSLLVSIHMISIVRVHLYSTCEILFILFCLIELDLMDTNRIVRTRTSKLRYMRKRVHSNKQLIYKVQIRLYVLLSEQ